MLWGQGSHLTWGYILYVTLSLIEFYYSGQRIHSIRDFKSAIILRRRCITEEN
jgi:hypothetical protein